MGRTVGAARRDLGEAALAQRERQEHGAAEPRHSAQAHPAERVSPRNALSQAGARRGDEGARGRGAPIWEWGGWCVAWLALPDAANACVPRACSVQLLHSAMPAVHCCCCCGTVTSATPLNAPVQVRRRPKKHARCVRKPSASASKKPSRGTSTARDAAALLPRRSWIDPSPMTKIEARLVKLARCCHKTAANFPHGIRVSGIRDRGSCSQGSASNRSVRPLHCAMHMHTPKLGGGGREKIL